MAIYYVKRDYKIELVPLNVKCPECGLHLETTEYSNQKQTLLECDCCGHMLDIKIIVCPECNSSAHMVERGAGAYYCNTCEKLVMNDNIRIC